MMIQADSSSASMTFDGQTVTIHRTRARGNHPVGARSFPLGQIAGIQLKPAQSRFTGGWIKLIIPGTTEHVRRGRKAIDTGSLTDPNTVAFSRKTQPQFEHLKAAVEAAIKENGRTSEPTVVDQLADLERMFRQGVLTSDQFESAKRRMLG